MPCDYIERDFSDVIDALLDLGYRIEMDDEQGIVIKGEAMQILDPVPVPNVQGSLRKRHDVWDDASYICQLLSRGRTAKYISKLYGCSDGLIYRVAKENGFDIPNDAYRMSHRRRGGKGSIGY